MGGTKVVKRARAVGRAMANAIRRLGRRPVGTNGNVAVTAVMANDASYMSARAGEERRSSFPDEGAAELPLPVIPKRSDLNGQTSVSTSPAFTNDSPHGSTTSVASSDSRSSASSSRPTPSPRGNMVHYRHAVGVRAVNSTLNVFVDTTISSLRPGPLIHCVASYLLADMQKERPLPPVRFADERQGQLAIFNELLHPTIEGHIPGPELPSLDDIEDWLTLLLETLVLTADSLLIVLVYLDRLQGSKRVPLVLTSKTWRRTIMAAVMLAAKVVDDLAVWTSDMLSNAAARSAVQFVATTDDLNSMERACLNILDYDVGVKANAYAATYFRLRDFAIQNNISLGDLHGLENAAQAMQHSACMLYVPPRPLGHAHRVSHDQHADLRRSTSDVTMLASISAQELLHGVVHF